jgi:hypothetical protein
MMRLLIKPLDLAAAIAPAAASYTLGQFNDILATLAGIFGVIFCGLGIALRWRKWRRGE